MKQEELIKIIKALAKDLESRAEEIASDFNHRIRSIIISTDIEFGNIPEWNITKNYPVIVLTDEIVDKIEDIVNNPNDAPKSMRALASIQTPLKEEKSISEEIGNAIKDSININIGLPSIPDMRESMNKAISNMRIGGGG